MEEGLFLSDPDVERGSTKGWRAAWWGVESLYALATTTGTTFSHFSRLLSSRSPDGAPERIYGYTFCMVGTNLLVSERFF